jgi:GntR family transcriptional regulator, histidine utilization repressor
VKSDRFNSWEAVHGELRRRITFRIWQPGEKLPGEEDLAIEFGCARTTVNRAMRVLSDAGLVERRRKAGTHVTLTPVRTAKLEISIVRKEVEAKGESYRFVVLDRTVLPAPMSVCSRLGLQDRTQMLYVRTLHIGNDKPFAHEERWLNPAVLSGGADADFGDLSINEWLVRNIAYEAGDISFTAEAGNSMETNALEVPLQTALFIVERTTRTMLQPVTLVRLAYAPGYRMHTAL